MKLEKPSTHAYSSVIEAWGKNRKPGSFRNAIEIFNLMQERYSLGDINARPTVSTYNALINALANSNEDEAAEKAEVSFMEIFIISCSF